MPPHSLMVLSLPSVWKLFKGSASDRRRPACSVSECGLWRALPLAGRPAPRLCAPRYSEHSARQALAGPAPPPTFRHRPAACRCHAGAPPAGFGVPCSTGPRHPASTTSSRQQAMPRTLAEAAAAGAPPLPPLLGVTDRRCAPPPAPPSYLFMSTQQTSCMGSTDSLFHNPDGTLAYRWARQAQAGNRMQPPRAPLGRRRMLLPALWRHRKLSWHAQRSATAWPRPPPRAGPGLPTSRGCSAAARKCMMGRACCCCGPGRWPSRWPSGASRMAAAGCSPRHARYRVGGWAGGEFTAAQRLP